MYGSFVKSTRVLLVSVLLTASSSWCIFNSSIITQKHSFVPPKSLSAKSIRPEATGTAKLHPVPKRLPPTEATLHEWQGAVEPVLTQPQIVPVLDRIPTNKPVIFLGIDDGAAKSPEAQRWLLEHHLPFSLFLDNANIQSNYGYFRQLQTAGMGIEDHTLTHPYLRTLTQQQQQAEICGAADTYQAVFGKRPTLFRPPYGELNGLTHQAAANCGMKAIITWHAKVNGGSVQFQENNTHFLPGDIVLMHFRPEFLQDMKAFTNQAAKDHLQVARLEDWISTN
jgi:peptidoglycan/xylan/chitin deacetylase (PgdA/CDA1 family)